MEFVFAKSHLLAALLRYKSIPTGFCYQKLILDDETAPVLIYHGFNGVYIEEDGFVIYPDPDRKVLEKFKRYKTRTELWADLPTELGYNA